MRLPRAHYLILSCEHGGNRLAPRFRQLFSAKFLKTHRGYDPGALELARAFARATGAPLFYSTVSRLLVELNRPPGHPQVFHFGVPLATRDELLRRYYVPYWRAIEKAIARALRRGQRVLHLSVHSFTPRFRGVRRTTDVGLLFDPRRPLEERFCRRWKQAIERVRAGLVVRYNDPYPGAHPSVVAAMREKFAARRYLGVQIEINQKYPRGEARRWRQLRRALVASFPAINGDV